MSHRCSVRRRSEGFILLYTLWLLLTAVALYATISAVALQRAKTVAAASVALRQTAAAESAVHSMLFRLSGASYGPPRRAYSEDLQIDGRSMRVEVVVTKGLVSLNSADDPSLMRVAVAAGAQSPRELAASIRKARPITSHSQLVGMSGLSEIVHTCLRRYVSLSLGMAAPASELAPTYVQRALALASPIAQGGSAAAELSTSISGSNVRLTVDSLNPASGQRLVVEAILTGRLDRPVSIIDWEWLPTDPKLTRHCEGASRPGSDGPPG